MVKYSIITPMYNSFDLMNNYFQSLINQTYKDFEVIIVDDCSTDNSMEKLKEYTKNNFLNIKIFGTKKNSGPGNARNIGISHAEGDWITFIDNDDWIENNFFEEINKVINSNNVNCIIFDYFSKSEAYQIHSKSMYKGKGGLVSTSECVKFTRNHILGKVYNRQKLINAKVIFPDIRRNEDVAFVAQAIVACEDVYYLNKPLYYYYQRSGSLSNNCKIDERYMVEAFNILDKKIGHIYYEELKEKSVSDLLYGVVLMMCKAKKNNGEILKYIRKYEAKYPKWNECEMFNALGTSKKLFLISIKMHAITLLKVLSMVHSKIIKS